MINISNNTKGVLLAIAGALAVSNVYIFSKAALNEIHLAQFGFYWFGLGIIWNLIYIISFGKYKLFFNIKKSSFLALLAIASLEVGGTLFFFLSIKTVSNPAVVSFLANMNPLFVVIMGIIFLRERLNKLEISGIVVILLGTIIISLKGASNIDSIFIPGVQYVLISGLIYSIATVIAKKQIMFVDASLMALSRILLLFIFSVGALIVLDLPITIPSSAFKNVAIGSVLGPFLTATLGYLALKYIKVSKASMIGSIRSLFVLFGAFVYFGNFPTYWQIIGGVITISGVILISLGKMKLHKSS
jgi:drug/metabolite transporter (DMT)-like permease